ncbi:MAG: hypothetical protein ACREDT_04740 [Methylocella sp.]
MTTGLRSIVSAILFTFLSHAAYAEPPTRWKAHELPPAEEKRWIETVETHKTTDGATVMEVLKHAEQMRPKRFKLAAIQVGYNGASGEPDAVVISYFVGMKRLDGDSYSIGYDIKLNGKEIQLSVPRIPATDDTPINALEGGRDSFLLKVDEFYKDTCIDPDTNAKLC